MYKNQLRIQDLPEEGAPTPQRGPTYDFAIFSQKLHEIERIWAPGGASLRPPFDPPLRTYNFKLNKICVILRTLGVVLVEIGVFSYCLSDV